jgi:hypothetical protein
MVDPFEAVAVEILLGSERALVELPLGALIGHRTLGTIERHAIGIAFEEILADLRADLSRPKRMLARIG